MTKESGLRFNDGKLRYDLVHPIAHEGMVKVLTRGAAKYAPRNWEKGMPWSTVLASLKRHIAAFEKGEDYDPETGLLHVDHIQCNAHFLSAYYHIAPQFDDRAHSYKKGLKVGLDIDEVLCGWLDGWRKKFGYEIPNFWNFSYHNDKHFKSLQESGEIEEFYLNLPRKIEPGEIKFEPHCYITSRSVPVELTQAWLQKNGFATAPVYSVGFHQSKVQAAKESGIDIFVDDNYFNFVELNCAGICTFLLDASHNRRYDVGYKRIYHLNELPV